jgi:transcriptional regulator with XRE-family HTH domain
MKKIEKLDLIKNLTKEENLTAYEIGKNTKISTFAIQKIINGETKNPNESTLDAILSFLNNAKSESLLLTRNEPDTHNQITPKECFEKVEKLLNELKLKDKIIDLLTEKNDLLNEKIHWINEAYKNE